MGLAFQHKGKQRSSYDGVYTVMGVQRELRNVELP